jgi:cobalt-zinc-cadmium efflux system protein
MSHNHHKTSYSTDINKAFIIGILLNVTFVICEIIAGFMSNSLSLLTDAFHNLGDVAGLTLALIAFRLSFKKATDKFTYGFKKSTILVSVINAIILLIAIGAVGYEAIQRLKHPEPIVESTVIIVAFIGIIINAVSAWLFFRDKNKDLNIKSAYIHMAGDALVSAGVVITAAIIYFTKLYWLDPMVSLLIILVIIRSSYVVLKESIRLSLDAVPAAISISEIREHILEIKGIIDIHDLHIWPMSTTETALTVHVVLTGNPDIKETTIIKNKITDLLKHHDIFHTTIDFEHKDNPCEQQDC